MTELRMGTSASAMEPSRQSGKIETAGQTLQAARQEPARQDGLGFLQRLVAPSAVPRELGYVPLRPWWWLCRTAVFVLFWLWFKSRAVRIHRVPRSGPVILACNHQSFFDPILATVGLNREAAYMARDSLFANPYFGWLIRSLNAIPIKRGHADVTSLKEMLRRLRDNYVVVIFPEETRTSDGCVGPMKSGTVLIARKAKATIVPVCIEGAYQAWPRTRVLPGPGRIVVSYGEPITPEQMAGVSDEEVTGWIRQRIIRMQEQIHANDSGR